MKRHNLLTLLLDILAAAAYAIRTTISIYQMEQELAEILRDCAARGDASLASPTPPLEDEKWIDEIEERIMK